MLKFYSMRISSTQGDSYKREEMDFLLMLKTMSTNFCGNDSQAKNAFLKCLNYLLLYHSAFLELIQRDIVGSIVVCLVNMQEALQYYQTAPKKSSTEKI